MTVDLVTRLLQCYDEHVTLCDESVIFLVVCSNITSDGTRVQCSPMHIITSENNDEELR